MHGGAADLLDGGQGVADGEFAAGLALKGEVGAGAVDVGRQQGDGHAAGFLAQGGEAVGVVDGQRHAGGDEGFGVVGLHPGGLVGDQGVRGRVAFVEAIIGELGHQVEDFAGLFRLEAAGHGAVAEDFSLRVHFSADLLAHGAAQEIGGAEGVAGHGLGDLHHLFLVDHDAVGLGQDVVDGGVGGGPFLAVLALAIGGDAGHRARAVEGDGGDQVFEAVGAHLAQDVAHALALELEDAAGVAALEHGEGGGVVERDAVDVDGDALAFQEFDGALEDGQRGEAEEVEFHQAGLLDVFHRVLRDEVIGFGVAVDRDHFGEGTVADDQAGGVGAGVAVEAL